MKKIKQKLNYFDFYLFVPYLLLCIIGIVMVYSASSINLSYAGMTTNFYLLRQMLYVFLGFICFFIASLMRLELLTSKKFIIYGFGILALLLVYAKFMTKAVNGANGWINFKIFSLQPSELCKLYLVIFVAQLLAYREQLALQNSLQTASRKPWLLVALLLLLILMEPDLGGFAINFMIVLVMYLASQATYKSLGRAFLLLGGFFASVVVVISGLRFWNPLAGTKYNYMYSRLTAFYNPFKVAASSGQQLINSYYAISNGGLFGLGLGNSIQKRGYLPEAYTDFIMAIISEELGVVGIAVILILISWLTLRIFLIGIRSKNNYQTLVCYGIGTFFAVETFFNLGAVTGLLPITGVTFPFVSYGGSSMLVLSITLGIAMNISMRQRRMRLVGRNH
ncbi:FtsW/RodA/SpoVE family cell cycle protein [Liquorilactobacillus nagelii]|uniref:FtsW/RodA/SpoVE family cell cycle protein n=1 Tax=Liquorilactobacillus nagelii TaxID=82688 RepID=UPI0039E866C4